MIGLFSVGSLDEMKGLCPIGKNSEVIGYNICVYDGRVKIFFCFSSRRRHTRFDDWSSDVCSSDLNRQSQLELRRAPGTSPAGDKRSSRSTETRRLRPAGTIATRTIAVHDGNET